MMKIDKYPISVLRKVLRCKKIIAAVLFLLVTSMFSPAYVTAIGFDAEQTYASVFVIYSDLSLGSGFSVGKNLIITNAHVVAGAEKIIVTSYQGDEFEANISSMDEELDIAALWVDSADFPVLTAADYRDCKLGEDVYAIGTPNSMDYTLTKGVLSAKERKLGANRYLQIDAAINSGNSGGPLLNDAGAVIGVNTLKITNSEGIGLAVPMTAVFDFLDRSGIEIDQDGNVSGFIKPLESQKKGTTSGKTSGGTPETGGREMNPKIALLMILLVLSMSFNVALVLLLVFRKKNEARRHPSPDRTDFEIDIME